jgi:hypothetical protein
MDEHNHALDALRYLVSKIGHRQMARLMGKGGAVEVVVDEAEKAKLRQKKWLSVRNERWWTRVF